MILATELRIGNLFKGIAGIQTVFAIEDNTERGKYNMDQYNGYSHLILCKENGNQYKPWEIEPIPLTEEWLLKFGGNVKPFSIGVILDRFRFIWKKEYKYWYVIAADPGESYMTKIEFVHELQNFFQSTNGQELTLKP